MPGTAHHRILGLSLVALVISGANVAQGQTRLPKPIIGTPTVVTGPATLSATAARGRISLAFPPVANAQAYRVTRSANLIIDTDKTIYYEGPTTNFIFEGNNCSVTSSQPGCVYLDTKVDPRLTYTYQVWAIYAGPVVSPPSPSATIHAQ